MVHRGDERKGASEAPPVPRPPHQPHHRIGDAERQQAVDVLRSHTGAGRLTLDEFSDLAGEVYAAQTFADLEEVGRRLPPGLLPDPSAAPADAGRRRRRRPRPPPPPTGPGASASSG